MPSSSRIFTGFRALGLTSNEVPLAVRYRKKHRENYIVTCVGEAFHTYNSSKLGIVNVSDALPDQITCLAVDGTQEYTGCGKMVRAHHRGKHVIHTYEGHENTVHLVIPFGLHLISVDEGGAVKVWDKASEEIYMELQFDNNTFQITAAVHPSTYLNKILFGSRQGTMQLWNLKTTKLLYTFQGWGSPITALMQAPAVDVVAIGLASGQVMLHNIKYDETVLKFTQDWGPVTTIAFRTDGNPIMATGSTAGHIALWNLEEKKLQSQIRDAHSGAVTGMACLPSEPLLVTSSPDNSLKVWIFDQPDGGGRLLRCRDGHSAPPHKVRYHGNNGEIILSAGQDSTLRLFSTVHDSGNKSLGRASFNKAGTKKSGLKLDKHMMPPIVDFASESSRQSDWDSIAACHRGLKIVTTWNYQKSTMGAHRLLHDRFKDEKLHHLTTAQSVTISSCGNFAVIGYSTGHVDLFNMQSGIHRGSYGNPKAHTGAVRGVAIDALNQVTVTAAADCCVKFWKFKTKELLESMKIDSQAAKIFLHRESSMLAVAMDDFRLIIIDIDTRKIVRTFAGHRNSITDMCYSPDARWLVTASMDSSIRVWDLPTGRLIDCFLMDAPVTSISMSPTGDFLVTTHVDDLGIYLWSNMTLYTHVALKPLPADFEPQVMQMPSTSRRSQGLIEEVQEEEEEYLVSDFKSPEQISDELITLSLLPNSRWQNLLNLDIIKQRNKPRKPPKVPKAAPFFLPTVAGLQPTFAVAVEDMPEDETSHVKLSSLQNLSPFGQMLLDARKTRNFGPVMSQLKEMGPSAIDAEFRTLAPDCGGSLVLMEQFMKFINSVLQSNRDFELAQAYLGLFIKLHGGLISSEPTLVAMAEELQKTQQGSWCNLQEKFNQSLCLVNYLRSATL